MTPFETPASDGKGMTDLIFGYGSDGKKCNIPISVETIYPSSSSVSAFHVAVAKNKRKQNGDLDNVKWYLPGISELEQMLINNRNFIKINEFYWSACPGRRQGTWPAAVLHPEDGSLARSTKVDADGNYVTSGSYNNNDNYPRGGRTSRTQPLRVRAIRTAEGVKTN